MYIEDLIQLVTATGKYMFGRLPAIVTGNDYKILESISSQISWQNNNLTERQSQLVIKLLKKNQDSIRLHVPSIDQDLADPKWKNPFRIIPTVKKISIGNLEGTTKRILVEFPYLQEVVDSFRQRNQEVHELYKGTWSSDKKKWIFFVTENTVKWLGDKLLPMDFQADEEFLEIYSSVGEVLNNIENYLPMLVQTNNGFEIKNAHPKCPPINSTSLVEALFQARNYGVNSWDDVIESRLHTEVHPVTRAILSVSKKDYPWIDSAVHGTDAFKDLINYGGPALIIIPGGSELEQLKQWHSFAQEQNIGNEQLSVMFRLPNEHADFNVYVKDNNLNSPITEDTRLVFVSTKITKPLAKSGVRFNTVINLGYYNYMHFSMSTVVDNSQNLVYYSMKAPTKNNRWQPHEL